MTDYLSVIITEKDLEHTVFPVVLLLLKEIYKSSMSLI